MHLYISVVCVSQVNVSRLGLIMVDTQFMCLLWCRVGLAWPNIHQHTIYLICVSAVFVYVSFVSHMCFMYLCCIKQHPDF